MTRHPTTAAAAAASLHATGLRLRHVVALWRARASERRMLAAMTARERRDIGLSPGEASIEASKPFWAA